MSAAEPEVTPPPKPKWSRWRKIFAVIGALILVFVAADVAYQYLDSLPPDVAATGPPGHAYLDVTLFTFYTPSFQGSVDLNASTMVTFAAGAHFQLAWENTTASGLPVRFVLAPSRGFASGRDGAFTYRWATGTTSVGTVLPGHAGGIEGVWRMDYTVRRMSAWEGFTRASWVEVDYSLSPLTLEFGNLPLGNVSAPGPAVLLPTGVAEPVDVNAAPGTFWFGNWSLGDFRTPSAAFVHTLPATLLGGGGAGSVTATLASTFEWAKGDNYQVEASFSGLVHGTLTWYWDARFGSLVPVFSG